MTTITVTVDKAAVEKKLGNLASKSRTVIARGLNKTAKSARKRLAEKAQETYTAKKVHFNSHMKLKSATAGNLVAELDANGKPLSITGFSHRAPKREGGKAQILAAGSMKAITMSGIKSFKRNGLMMQRRGKARLPVKVLKSNSVPVMLGSEKRVYGIIKPHIKSDLQKNIDAEISRLLGG